MKILYCHKYVSPRTKVLSWEEKGIRDISYTLKDRESKLFNDAINLASERMAKLIPSSCVLVPIPSSKGDVAVNRILANAIAKLVPQAEVVDCLCRTQAVESSCSRHRSYKGPLPVSGHCIVCKNKRFDAAPVYFIDNVSTSGNTIKAARAAVGIGNGLVFADADLL